MSFFPFPANSFVSSPRELASLLDIAVEPLERVQARYPLRISRYYLELIRRVGAPLSKQVVPELIELVDDLSLEDSLQEEACSPNPCLIHKYPDRALLLVAGECATYCRFCTRKRKVGQARMRVSQAFIEQGLVYLRENLHIREVLLSGGDPLMRSDSWLEWLLNELRRIPSIGVIRIGTRMPCTFPARITRQLAAMLGQYHPLYINTHFNHPAEITPEASLACARLADAGIPLGCQTVLLRGINDCAEVLEQLFRRLLEIRVKPYYLFQADLNRGSAHFRTSIECGQAIMRTLMLRLSGMALPRYFLDTPQGGGKIPLGPNYIEELGKNCRFKNIHGESGSYPNQPWPEAIDRRTNNMRKKPRQIP